MFDKFSDNAKRLMSRARQQALDLRHGVIAPEHLLLGILDLPKCTAHAMLSQFGVSVEALRAAVLAAVPAGATEVAGGQLPFTPTGKKVLEQMLYEASELGSDYLGSEHTLLALTLVPDTVPHRVLQQHGVTAERLRAPLRAVVRPSDPDALRLLLISNSTMHGGGYLEHAAAEIRDFLGPSKRVLFVPFALADHDAYTAKVQATFAAFGHGVVPAHALPPDDVAFVLGQLDAVFIGGGNTFRLLKALHDRKLL
ncbi:MAG: Type 1 glutamine amidotransferase-like domain-containing protein, partial [Planctomycetota bacterium]